jgi:hypothetical protein
VAARPAELLADDGELVTDGGVEVEVERDRVSGARDLVDLFQDRAREREELPGLAILCRDQVDLRLDLIGQDVGDDRAGTRRRRIPGPLLTEVGAVGGDKRRVGCDE